MLLADISVLALVLATIIWVFRFTKRRVKHSIKMPSTSVLLAHYTRASIMMPVQQGQIGDIHYSAIATISLDALSPFNGGLIIRVELPFRTKVHLLGIPKNDNNKQLNPAYGSSLMEKVDLEGDYNNYFNLYCEKGMQQEVRYILDPKAMAFTVDFCRSHNWEIIHDELYFLQNGGDEKNDSTSMWDDVNQFIKEIKPAVESKNSPLQDSLRTPYGQDRRKNLKCPLCSKVLLNKTYYFLCPNQDGILAFGSMLKRLRTGKLDIVPNTKQIIPERREDIICPSCDNPMTRIPYNNGPIIIDTCSRCPYRWLDAGEFVKQTQPK